MLIIGATGGVGSFATQLAAARGAYVIATARAGAGQWIRGLGASETIDYAERPVSAALAATHPEGIDALLDLVGDKQLFATAAQHVHDGGVATSIAFGAPGELTDDSRITASNYVNQRKQALLGRVSSELAARRIRAEIQTEVPLDQAPAALARNRAGDARGKTVIRI